MLPRSRVARKPDMNRMGEAMARPGMDTRTWVYLAVVDAFKLDPDEGAFADVTRLDTGEPETVRVGAFYKGPGFGFYAPLDVNDEVVVEVPGGDPDQGGVIVARTWSASDPPSSTAKDNPTDVSLHIKDGTNLRIAVTGSGKVLIGEAGKSTKAVARKADPVDMGKWTLTTGTQVLTWFPPGVDPTAVPPPVPTTIGANTPLTGQISGGSSKVEASD